MCNVVGGREPPTMILNFIVTDYPNIRIIGMSFLKHVFDRRIARLLRTITGVGILIGATAITTVVISVLDVLNL